MWPTAGHGANSDPWLVAHHDVITQMSPRVMVLDFDNGATPDQVMATAQLQASALAEGSRYHGYADSTAAPFLKMQIVKVVDLTDHPPPASWTHPSSTLLPTTSTGEFDATALFTARFNDSYGFPDPSSPSGSLSLCQLFEQGLINEVWIEDGEPDVRRAPLNVERKQAYDASGAAMPGMFLPDVGGGGSLNQIVCGVTVRMAHLDPARGPGCDLQVRGWGIDGMWDALPAAAADARAFLNADFDSRFGVQFASFADICDLAGDSCVTYPSADGRGRQLRGRQGWRIDPFLQGCGSSRYPPNARGHGDFVQQRARAGPLRRLRPGRRSPTAATSTRRTPRRRSRARERVPRLRRRLADLLAPEHARRRQPRPRRQRPPIKNWWPYLYY